MIGATGSPENAVCGEDDCIWDTSAWDVCCPQTKDALPPYAWFISGALMVRPKVKGGLINIQRSSLVRETASFWWDVISLVWVFIECLLVPAGHATLFTIVS